MYHPSLSIIICIFILLLSYKNKSLFNIIAIIYPLAVLLLLPISENISIFEISTIKLIANFSPENTLIAKAFTIIALSANCYGISQGQRLPIIIGGFYFASSLVCLYADDLISFFISMELMMVASSGLIYFGGSRRNLLAARQYFITHLISGSMILVGICCIIAKTDNTKIEILTELITKDTDNIITVIIILSGCLVNVAAVPFSWWMTNCYPVAKSTSFIYLFSFTTKIAILTLIKLFYGLALLKWFGALMIIYGGIYACICGNLKRLLCYLAIAQLGYLMVMIGADNLQLSELIIIKNYIANHIIYNALFALLIVILADNLSITDSLDIKHIKNPLWVFSIIIVLLMLSNFPFSSNFLYKFALASISRENAINAIIMLFNITIFIAIPIKAYFISQKNITLEIDKYQISSILILVLTLLATNLKLIYNDSILPPQNMDKLFFATTGKQLALIFIGIILAISVKITREIEQIINFNLFKKFSSSINKIYVQYKLKTEHREDSGILELIRNFATNTSIFDNQQTAIAIVFFLLSSLIFFLWKFTSF